MPGCKNCKSESVVKNGFVRGKQRYHCKECGYNFVEGDERTNEKIALSHSRILILSRFLLQKTNTASERPVA